MEKRGKGKVLSTDRLVLSELALDDVDKLLQMFTDPEVMRYYPKLLSRDETEKWVESSIESFAERGYGLWGCWQEKTFIGQCGLVVAKDVDGCDEVELGYLFRRDHWGNGYATEAAIAVAKWWGERRLISLIDVRNERSKGVAERVGMFREKTITRWNKPVDVYCRGISK